jgi:hypothetical protein
VLFNSHPRCKALSNAMDPQPTLFGGWLLNSGCGVFIEDVEAEAESYEHM